MVRPMTSNLELCYETVDRAARMQQQVVEAISLLGERRGAEPVTGNDLQLVSQCLHLLLEVVGVSIKASTATRDLPPDLAAEHVRWVDSLESLVRSVSMSVERHIADSG